MIYDFSGIYAHCFICKIEYLEKAIISTRCDNIRASLIVQRNSCHQQIECTKRRLENKIKRDLNRDHSKASAMNMDDLDPKPLGATYQELFHVMQEHNELLNCLIGQKQPSDVQSTSNSPSRASPTGEMKFKSGTRKPKEDKEVIEELKTVNDKLRQWVHHLVEGVERAQQEIRQLKDENGSLRKELTTLKTTLSSNNKTIPELPPLEPPKLLY